MPPLKQPFLRTLLIAAAVAAPLLLSSAGELRVAGDNTYGQLGNGESNLYNEFVEIAQNVVRVSAGDEQVLFKDTDGKLWLIGWNSVGHTTDAPALLFGESYTTPTFISDKVENFEAESYWNFFTFQNDNRLYSTGLATRGIDGLGVSTNRETPTIIEGPTDIVQSASTYSNTLYLQEGGNLYGMGDPLFIGLGFSGSEPEQPTLIAEQVLQIGFENYCALYLHSSGELYKSIFSGGFEVVASDVTSFSSGASSSIYVIDGASTLFHVDTSTDTKVAISSDVRSVLAHDRTAFYLTYNDELWAIGENSSGLMGKGDFADASEAVLVMSNVESISMNEATLYVHDKNGVLFAAGSNSSSQMGLDLANEATDPVSLASDVVDLSTGYQNIFYIDSSQDLYGLGRNDVGQLGLTDFNHRLSAELIDSGIKQVSSHGSNITSGHTVYTGISGNLWGMGSNAFYQINDNGGELSIPQLIDTEVTAAVAGPQRTSYLKSDGTLWQRGDAATGASMIAEGVADFDSKTVMFYVTADGDLNTKDQGFINNYKVENDIEFDEVIETLTIDTNVTTINAENAVVAYINEDDELRISGSRGYIGDGGYIVEPLLLDTEVARVSFSSSSLLYQKLDGTMWLIAKSLDHYPPEYEEIPSDPIEVYQGLNIENFSAGETNTAILVAPEVPPTIESIGTENEDPIAPGEPITLTAEIAGEYSEFTWFEGEVGDKSNPLESEAGTARVVYPYYSTEYWLEVSNDTGSASSEESVSVEVVNADYADWASANGLQGANGAYLKDPEGDGNPNLLEFVYDLDPTARDTSPWAIELKVDEQICEFSISKNTKDGIVGVVQSRTSATEDWEAATDIPEIQVFDDADTITVIVPMEALPSVLVRLRVVVQ